MSNEWLNKAKEMALNAANTAKDAAKNANYAEMLNKTKVLAAQATEEAKKAANSIMSKEKTPATVATTDNPDVLAKLTSVETLLQEVKAAGNASEASSANLVKIEALLQEIKTAVGE